MASSLRVPIPRPEPTDAPRSLTLVGLTIRVGLAMLTLGVLIAAVELVWARHHLTTGASDLNAAFNTVRSPAALSHTSSRNAAIEALASARNEFQGAHDDLDLWSPLLATMRWVPHYGKQITAASPVATAALETTSSAYDIVDGLRGVWPLLDHHTSHQHQNLLAVVGTTVTRQQSSFVDAINQADEASSVTATLHGATGSTQLDNAIGKLKQALPRLRAAGLWLSMAPVLLGDRKQQQYLFAWENADEIRATGGFIGAADTITMNHGTLSKHFTGSVLNGEGPPNAPVPPPVPESVTTRETSWLFRDSNFSPDFPTSARLERWFFDRGTHDHVDGVIDFVDQGVPYILSSTGPVYIPQYHVTATAKNAVALANHYATANSVPGGFRGPNKYHKGGNLDTYRKQFLGFEVSAILKRLQSLPADRWGPLGTNLSIAIRRHDILLWSKNPSVERAINASSAGGELTAQPGDDLYVVDDNRSYNKIGPYIREWATYNTQILPTYWLSSSLTIHYHLLPSPSNLEGRGPDFGTTPGHNKHQFRDFLRVYVPNGAANAQQSGLHLITQNLAQPAYDLTQISGWFDISPGQTKKITISYQTPANALAFDRYREYKLTILREPGTRLKGVLVNLQGLSGITLGPTRSSSVRQWVSLTANRSFTIPIHGTIARSDQPSITPILTKRTRDPWIPWKELTGIGKS